jgi:hypothetical protein
MAAITSFLLFSAGAIISALPYVLADGNRAVIANVMLSVIGLFAIRRRAGNTRRRGQPI